MSQENEIEAEKPSITTDLLPSGEAFCSPPRGIQDVGNYYGGLSAKTSTQPQVNHATFIVVKSAKASFLRER